MVTRSLLHLKSETFGSKIAPSATTVTASSSSVANRGAHKTLAGLVFQAHNGLKCHPMRSKCLIGHIHTSCHAQTMESLVLLWDNSHFSMLKHTKHSFSPAKRRSGRGLFAGPDPYWASKSPLFAAPVLTRL